MRLLSVGADEVPASIERLQAEAKEQRRALSAIQLDLARYKGEELAAAAEATAKGRLVLRGARRRRQRAEGARRRHRRQAGLRGRARLHVSSALVVVARAADSPVQANQVLAALTKQFGGRGGGKPEMAQGGGLNASPEAVLAAARAAILG